MKKDTEKAVIRAMEEMTQAKLPIHSFEPAADGFDFVFSKGLTPEQQSKALAITSKYISVKLTFYDAKP